MQKQVYIIGLPFFSKKYYYHCLALTSNREVSATVLINADANMYSGEIPFGVSFHLCGKNHFKRLFFFTKKVIKDKPVLLEVYDYSILTLFYILVANFLKIKTRLWIIGAELLITDIGGNYYSNKFISPIRNIIKYFMTKICLFCVDNIAVKEFHHLSELKKISKSLLNKTEFIHNAVPCSNVEHVDILLRPKDFLYANLVEPTRNVLELVQAFKEISTYAYCATIVGLNCVNKNDTYCTYDEYSNKVRHFVDTNNLKTRIVLKPFLSDISKEFDLHKFFVFPARSVFANYALLEAMERGLIPIVLDGLGYDQIVKDNINGLVVRNMDIKTTLLKALSLKDCDIRRMSCEAKKTIINKFSFDNWSKKINMILNGARTIEQ